MDLPFDLRNAIESELASVSTKNLATSSMELSKRYRASAPANGRTFFRTREDFAAYAAFRLPATFAAVYSALCQIRDQLPTWQPMTLLDVGAGPGTAMWAATLVWPSLNNITLLEREGDMIALGKRLAAHADSAAVRSAGWNKVDITGPWDTPSHDLVIASYVLGELTPDSRDKLVQKLWELTRGTLVLVEPGTPDGFSRIQEARQLLLGSGGKTVAPCPHDKQCPSDWCHFAQRVSRSRLHRQVKAGELAYEDEKFSFVGISRVQRASFAGRVIRHPQVRKGHIQLEICTPDGLQRMVVTRKDGARFRQARDLRWGDVMPSREEEKSDR
jgi:ribosomal protein RSM22 (predicted rRNA methylase)